MDFITQAVIAAVQHLYQTTLTGADVNLQETRKEFEGQVTVVTFPFTRLSRKSPEQTGQELGAYLQAQLPEVAAFNVIKGFLNISLSDSYWLTKLNNEILKPEYVLPVLNGKRVMVEYSSPNTNKPLHLGHVRNNLLGFSVAQILSASGYDVIKANLVNDRGIHICKSMLAWQLWGEGETPQSSGLKGDHLVGKYYVIFDKELKIQIQPILDKVYSERDLSIFTQLQRNRLQEYLQNFDDLNKKFKERISVIANYDFTKFGTRAGFLAKSALDGDITWKSVLKCFDDEEYDTISLKENKQKELNTSLKPIIEIQDKIKATKGEIKEIAQAQTSLMQSAQQMLQQWEAGQPEVIELWSRMNGWVYAGFEETYKKLGVSFDKYYYESDTYLLGKDIIEEGLQKGVFFKKDDNSVWIDLTANGLDQKLVLRADGTSVYITQDLGTAQLKYNDYHMDESVYVVGNEQDYHFKVLFLILEKLGKSWAKGLFHLSYGMVDLPSGKMKSREGTVVDADDLIAQMEETAKEHTEQLGKVEDFSEAEKLQLYHTIGMGALKYFLLKVEPKKRLLFNPNESIDFQGHTGPFIQYTYARIRSVLRKANADLTKATSITQISATERDLIVLLSQYRQNVQQAAAGFSPAVIANYAYELAKVYNKFYHENSILQAESEGIKLSRLQLSSATATLIQKCMHLLGIDVPERM